MKKILILFLILSPIFIIAQNQIILENIKSNNKPWTSPNANSDNFQFAIVTDRTGGHREGVFEKGVRKINPHPTGICNECGRSHRGLHGRY